ncbi:hypothetical protein BHM03_00061656 [Ensete ventricosum]|nr:hypothetical protein BHM03_00061656 [Ensete ventricosum]
MAGFGSPCGACKFLRRKCVSGCVFAPFFRHEQGAAHFAAIHKVFGASNVAKLLMHLPMADRSEAAITISYEAQARLQNPIYGCVAHIFALQQQVSSSSTWESCPRCLLNLCLVLLIREEDSLYSALQPCQHDLQGFIDQAGPFSSSPPSDVECMNSYNNWNSEVNFDMADEDLAMGIEKETPSPMACFDMQDDFWKSVYHDANVRHR